MQRPCLSVVLFVATCVQGPGQRASARRRDFEAERLRMVNEQLKARDIRQPACSTPCARCHATCSCLTAAHAGVPDTPLPIGFDQTISQPYIVAFMTQALDVQPSHRVLEIGTGPAIRPRCSGCSRTVHTIEIVEPLAARARATLADLGYRNVEVRAGNGTWGGPRCALRSHHGDGGA